MAAIWILSGLKTAKTVRFILSKLVRKRLNHGLITILCARFRITQKGPRFGRGAGYRAKNRYCRAHFISGAEDMHELKAGEVLVADMTDPDWEPIMKRAAAIVTRRGGRTCHAAIIARELGVPAIVGCGDSIGGVTKNEIVSVCCAEGDTGYVYEGAAEFAMENIRSDGVGALP